MRIQNHINRDVFVEFPIWSLFWNTFYCCYAYNCATIVLVHLALWHTCQLFYFPVMKKLIRTYEKLSNFSHHCFDSFHSNSTTVFLIFQLLFFSLSIFLSITIISNKNIAIFVLCSIIVPWDWFKHECFKLHHTKSCFYMN